MILQRKHPVHQSATPFQTECYSGPRHLAASFPFPTHAKNRKTPLPNCPICWRTLYIYLLFGLINYEILKIQGGAIAPHCTCLLAMHTLPITTFLSSGFLLFLNVEDFFQGPITNVSQEMCRTQHFSF